MVLAVQATELFVVLVWEKELEKGVFALITCGSPYGTHGTHSGKDTLPAGYTDPKDLTDTGVGQSRWEEQRLLGWRADVSFVGSEGKGKGRF